MLLEGDDLKRGKRCSMSSAAPDDNGGASKGGMWGRRRWSSGSSAQSATATGVVTASARAMENGAALAQQIAVGSCDGREVLIESGILSVLMELAIVARATGEDGGGMRVILWTPSY